MATFGTIPAFRPESYSIKPYLQRVKLNFTVNSVEDDKKVAILLISIEASTDDRRADILAPVDPSTKTFDQLTATLNKHFKPKRVQIAERFYFRKRSQAAGETIGEYDAALRKLATHCNFGNNLEDKLRDQLVCGLRNESVQRRLLSEVDLKYVKTIDIIRAAELADKNATAIRPSPTDATIHSIDRSNNKTTYRRTVQQTLPCSRCGGRHRPSDCKFKDATCHFCKKKGHLARVCRTKARGKTNTHLVEEEETGERCYT